MAALTTELPPLRISNVRQRRRHPIWDPNTWRDENLSPSFDEDTDEMGIDGHK